MSSFAHANDPQPATCYIFNGDTLKVKQRCVVDSGWAMGEGYSAYTIKGTKFVNRTFTKRDSHGEPTDEYEEYLDINSKWHDAQIIMRDKNLARTSNPKKSIMSCYMIKAKQINTCYQRDE